MLDNIVKRIEDEGRELKDRIVPKLREGRHEATEFFSKNLPAITKNLPVWERRVLGSIDDVLVKIDARTKSRLTVLSRARDVIGKRVAVLGKKDAPGAAVPAGYDALSTKEILDKLAAYGRPTLEAVRAHETTTKNRATVLKEIDKLLGVATA